MSMRFETNKINTRWAEREAKTCGGVTALRFHGAFVSPAVDKPSEEIEPSADQQWHYHHEAEDLIDTQLAQDNYDERANNKSGQG